MKFFNDSVVKVEIVSRYQTIIQTTYEVFVYRNDCKNGHRIDSFGQGRMELSEVCALRYSYCLDSVGCIKMMAIAVDKDNMKEDTIEFSGAEENLYNRNIRVYHQNGKKDKLLKKEFEINCN